MEDDGEIEYLDEDEDLVQQYVQKDQEPLPTPIIQSVESLAGEDLEDYIAPLLVERKPAEKRKHQLDDDSDYDPSEDLAALAGQRKKKKPAPTRVHKKPQITQVTMKQVNTQVKNVKQEGNLTKKVEGKLKNLPNLTVQKKPVVKVETPKTLIKKVVKKVDSVEERRKLGIRIPDYEDPICLPVRAIQRDQHDAKRLKLWNNLCLDHFKKVDTMLRPKRGDVVTSVRSVALNNIKNPVTGRIDTTVYGKITVENKWGEKRSETYQGTLPKYREKKVLSSYPLQLGSHRKPFKHIYEALLTKEEHKDGDTLVVYKPRESISAVYKLEKNSEEEDAEDALREGKRTAKEVACCKVCAPCYQASYRGSTKQIKQDKMQCAVCSRSFATVSNLLTHLNISHKPSEVALHKDALSETLAKVVEYHYRCRICQQVFKGIKNLRKHVPNHQGVELFTCEIGNHMAS